MVTVVVVRLRTQEIALRLLLIKPAYAYGLAAYVKNIVEAVEWLIDRRSIVVIVVIRQGHYKIIAIRNGL